MKGIQMLQGSIYRVIKRPIVRIGSMNTLIIVTAVVLTGPVNVNSDASPEAYASGFNHVHQAAFAAFDGPSSALSMGAGDSLGCEIYTIELVARRDSLDQARFASAE
jgi:hypothetical protein